MVGAKVVFVFDIQNYTVLGSEEAGSEGKDRRIADYTLAVAIP